MAIYLKPDKIVLVIPSNNPIEDYSLIKATLSNIIMSAVINDTHKKDIFECLRLLKELEVSSKNLVLEGYTVY